MTVPTGHVPSLHGRSRRFNEPVGGRSTIVDERLPDGDQRAVARQAVVVKAIRNPLHAETVLDIADVSVIRLNGRARDGVDGRHKRLVVYATATVSTGEIVRLLQAGAGRERK